MLKKIILTIFFVILPVSLLADELQLTQNAPESYVVKKGDTLWDISGVFLKEPWLWPKLWRLNPEIENPHLIYPGDELRLVYDEQGQPMLVKGKPSLKWSPKVRTSLKDLNPVESISLNTLSPFIKYNTILSAQEVDTAPYVLGNEEGYNSSVDGFKVYVNGNLEPAHAYAVYKKEEPIIDPETQQPIGYHAILVGTGKAIRAGDQDSKKPSTLYVDGVLREVRSGYIVKPVNNGQLLPSFFNMQSGDKSIHAKIIKTSSGIREFGKFEVVFINKGSQDLVRQGDVFSINRKSPGIVEMADGPVYTKDASRWSRLAAQSDSDYDMPTEAVGKMMVFKVFDQMSMALILSSNKPLRLADTVTAP